MRPVVLAGVVLAALFVGYGIYTGLERRKLHRRIRESFGKPCTEPSARMAGREFWDARLKDGGVQGFVDEVTWKDLDMDSLFLAANGCLSSVGDIWLYTCLREINPQRAAGREALIEALEDEGLRRRLQLRLGLLGRGQGTGLELAAYMSEALRENRVWPYRLLAVLPLLGLPLLLLSVQGGLFWMLFASVLNIALGHYIRGRRESGIATVSYLVGVVGVARRLATLLDAARPETARRLRAAAAPFGFLRRSHLVVQTDTLLTQAGLLNPLGIFQLPLLSFCKISRRLAGTEPHVRALYEAVGEVEVAIAVRGWRQALPVWCRPVYRAEMGVRAETLYHPLLEQPVANDVDMTGPALFTGANASGKSTFIKAVAVNHILAQGLHTCAAASCSLRAGGVATSMAVADSIHEGDSYFIAEIKSMRRLVALAQGGRPAVLFIDEILRGTNTVERVAAAKAVLAYLANSPCQCFAATHDMELTELLAGLYENYHFKESLAGGDVLFDYRLQPGPATTRNAIALLESLGFPAAITGEANRLASRFDAEGVWYS